MLAHDAHGNEPPIAVTRDVDRSRADVNVIWNERVSLGGHAAFSEGAPASMWMSLHQP